VLDSVTLREVDSVISSVLLESECENDFVFELELVTVLLWRVRLSVGSVEEWESEEEFVKFFGAGGASVVVVVVVVVEVVVEVVVVDVVVGVVIVVVVVDEDDEDVGSTVVFVVLEFVCERTRMGRVVTVISAATSNTSWKIVDDILKIVFIVSNFLSY